MTCSQLVGNALEAHALRRQHVENDGEDRDQHDADPVVRQADADDRGRGEQLVEPGVVIVGGQRAQQHAEQEAQHRRRQGEHEGIAQRPEQLLRHRPVGEEGDAEVSDQEAAEPSQVLHVDRLVEAEAAAQAVRDLLGHLRRHQDVDDVPGCEVDQREHQHRHAEQDRHGVEQAAKGIGPHGPLTSGGADSGQRDVPPGGHGPIPPPHVEEDRAPRRGKTPITIIPCPRS